MPKLNLTRVEKYVEKNIGSFHKKRLERLKILKLEDVLIRKNPYLFRCKNILVAEGLIRPILDAYLSSQEETIFGDFLEGVAIFVNAQVYRGRKSSTEGIDLEFEKDGARYIVAIKSGPNWANSSQIRKMREQFKTAKRILRTGGHDSLNVIAVNGCCYGKEKRTDKGDYFKYCGQHFWQFISGDEDLYLKIIKPLAKKAKEKNEEFDDEYARILNKFTLEFSEKFCRDGKIDWVRLVYFNSSK